jgi:hypothetical protein
MELAVITLVVAVACSALMSQDWSAVGDGEAVEGGVGAG